MKKIISTLLISFVFVSASADRIAGLWLGTFFMPNAISPNGDGKNDCFKILNLEKVLQVGSINQFSVKIYNRMGNCVFSSNNYNFQWSPQHIADGVYFYVIQSQIASFAKQTYKGDLTIVH